MSIYYNKAQIDAIAAVIGNRIAAGTAPATLRTLIDALPDTNFFTDAERAKLTALDTNRFFGTYSSLANIPVAGASEGMYAHIDTGAGNDVMIAHYDESDSIWVETGSASAETAASIKVKYESNADTNAFTDALLTKLDELSEASGITDFVAALDGAIG